MARIKNRKIWGLSLDYSDFHNNKVITINFGENRYGICSIKTFFQNAKSWKAIDNNGKRGGVRVYNLLDKENVNELSRSMFDSEAIELIEMAKGNSNIIDEVVNL